ncbi:hypothetical protein [Polymorphospora sp. NPDC050346]|uniref:hypothetical protein n=1 Tax=Polymorphospora sp. NPDC050346 TaxID=3155780 RepID=UPI0034050F50
MLQIRVEGDPAEADALLERLAAAGVEVQRSTTKDRGGFVHVYAMARMPDWQPASAGPVRVPSTVGRAVAVRDDRGLRRRR